MRYNFYHYIYNQQLVTPIYNKSLHKESRICYSHNSYKLTYMRGVILENMIRVKENKTLMNKPNKETKNEIVVVR